MQVAQPYARGLKELKVRGLAWLAAALMLCLLSGKVHAETACSASFARWVLNSDAALQFDAGQNACVPSESVRQSLQRSLAAVGRRCDRSENDETATKTLIEARTNFLASAPLCAAQPAAGPTGPQTATPGGECLSLEREGQVYWLKNKGCAGRKVIAVVEIHLSSGVIKCRGHVVEASRKLGTAVPTINYECVENTPGCSTKSVRAIFPFCAW